MKEKVKSVKHTGTLSRSKTVYLYYSLYFFKVDERGTLCV
jgi:hypothetical protein